MFLLFSKKSVVVFQHSVNHEADADDNSAQGDGVHRFGMKHKPQSGGEHQRRADDNRSDPHEPSEGRNVLWENPPAVVPVDGGVEEIFPL